MSQKGHIMLSVKQLNQKIAGIRTSANAIRNNVQDVLVSAAAHAYVHGDVSSLDKLYAATSGLNRKRIAKWVSDNGFAKLQKDGTHKLNKSMRKNADFADGVAVVEYLTNEVPAWYVDEESAAQITKELDAVARIKSLTAQIQREGTVVKNVDFAAYQTALIDLNAALKAAS
jgi:hypothetical protein